MKNFKSFNNIAFPNLCIAGFMLQFFIFQKFEKKKFGENFMAYMTEMRSWRVVASWDSKNLPLFTKIQPCIFVFENFMMNKKKKWYFN